MIDFFGKRKIFYTLSIAIILITLLGTLIPLIPGVSKVFAGAKLDIEFKGGSMVTYSYTGDIDSNEFAKIAEETVGFTMSARESDDIASDVKKIIISTAGTKSIDINTLETLTKKLTEAFSDNKITYVENLSVDATIGKEFLFKCLVAVGFAAILIILYIAIRFSKIGGFSAGVTGVIALVHDAIVVYAVFLFCGFSLNGNFIAVVLTILGYSINDTIVIYDRIRENEKIYGNKKPLPELVNMSINQSLLRSINTSVSTIIALVTVVVVAFIFNITTIITFALPLTIGVISGIYSTVFIAGPLWVDWRLKYQSKREKAHKPAKKAKMKLKI